jgi:diguanylate cyclase (GGDEF)-like protein/PAS domain S-box-containing protein
VPTQELPQEAGFYRDVIDNMSDGVYFVDRSRRITYWSRGAERLSGFPAEQVVGLRCMDGILNHVDDQGQELCGVRCPLRATMLDDEPHNAHVYMHHKDGHRQPVWVRASPLHGADGKVVGAVEVFSDDTAVTTARARLAEVEQLAVRDTLTGLGNRRFLEAQLESRLDEWKRHGWGFGILFADIDHFKAVNDTYGHAVGDEALTLVARTLSLNLRSSDTVSRFGGEEFVVVVLHATEQTLTSTAERLRALVEQSSFVAHGRRVPVTVSLGGAMVASGDTVASLLERADAQLYAAKHAGRNRVHIAPASPSPDPDLK